MIKKEINVQGISRNIRVITLNVLKGESMNLLKSHFFALFLLLCFLPSSVYAFEACYIKSDEEVIRWRIFVPNQELKACSTSNKKETEAAIDLIKAFWLSNKDHVSFLSQSYRKTIEASNLSFKDNHRRLFGLEQIWMKHEFKTINYSKEKFMQVIVLSTWDDQGYSGTMTFTFDLVYEDNQWKIEAMVY